MHETKATTAYKFFDRNDPAEEVRDCPMCEARNQFWVDTDLQAGYCFNCRYHKNE